MRNTRHLLHAEQLLAREVGHIAAELPGRQRRLHVRGIRQFAAGEVQQNRALLHLRNCRCVDAATRLIVERDVEGDVIRLCEYVLIRRSAVDAAVQRPCAFNRNKRVAADDLHAESSAGGVRDEPPNRAQTNHAERLSAQLRPDELSLALLNELRHVLLPLERIRPADARGNVAAAQPERAQHECRHGIGVRAGGIEHGNPLLGALFERDIIDARPGTRDAQQFRVQRRIVHDRRAHENALRHRFFRADDVLFRGQFLMDDIGNRIQRLDFEHDSSPSQSGFCEIISPIVPN